MSYFQTPPILVCPSVSRCLIKELSDPSPNEYRWVKVISHLPGVTLWAMMATGVGVGGAVCGVCIVRTVNTGRDSLVSDLRTFKLSPWLSVKSPLLSYSPYI